MKMNYALVTGLLLSTSLMAQTNSSSPAPTAPVAMPAPAPAVVTPVATPTPAAKPAAKPAPKKVAPAKPEPVVTLVPGPATVNGNKVNVRGRSTIMGEVLTQLNKGDIVTVVEQVENKWAKGDDKKQWARIAYPANAPVWVFASFVDADKKVTSARLNLRGGPGENYSIVGRLTKGATVKEIKTQGEWMQIEPPAEATAYIAAIYLKQDATAIAAAATVEPAKIDAPVIEPASTNVITDVEPAVPATVDATVAAAPVSSDLEAFLAGTTNAVVEPEMEVEEPLPPRVVMREGVVSGATSIQAPSYYSLRGLDTGRTINYLHSTSTNVHLGRYMNLRIVVTGEESLDERWPNTPVLTIQRIQVVE